MADRVREADVVVIGGGPAGLAAAASAAEAGASVVLVDRNPRLGGILNQCIHDGFGLHALGEVLTGPEFAARYVERALEAGVETHPDTLVAELTPQRELICTSTGSRHRLRAKSVILAMGCRERTRGMLRIPGTRPAGVYTAGTAQWLTNMLNVRVGRRVVILGSGDIGLIMARRLTWEDAEVVGVIELLPYASGLPRNISQCLGDYDIPLHLSHSVTCIHGKDRLEGVTVSRFDEKRQPIPGTEVDLACDTLLLSVGLIPENELSRRAGVVLDRTTSGACVDDLYMTSVDGIFSCGNVLHIHDLADWASDEGERAGRHAAAYSLDGKGTAQRVRAYALDGRGTAQRVRAYALGDHAPAARGRIRIEPGSGVRYVVPQTASRAANEVLLSFRVNEPSDDRTAEVIADGRVLATESLRHPHPATMVQMKVRCGDGLDVDRLEVRLA